MPAKPIFTTTALLLGASVANACPVCMLADPKTAGTYLSMTLMMSALPLAMLGGLIYWLKRRYSAPPAVARARRENTLMAELATAHRNF